MKLKTSSLILALIILQFESALAQSFIGRVLDSKTRQALAYVNIGIPSIGLGIISDEEGNYKLPLDKDMEKDTLRISLIGYKSLLISVKEYILQNDNNFYATILLEPNIYNLSEVTVKPRNMINQMIGNSVDNDHCRPLISLLDSMMKPLLDSMWKETGKGKKGFTEKHVEVGTIFEVKKRTTYIESVQIQFCKTDIDSIKLRLNIYSNLDAGRVGGVLKIYEGFTNVLKAPVYFTLKKGQTNAVIDLRDLTISVPGDFIIAIETLKTEDYNRIFFPVKKEVFGGEQAVFCLTNGTPFMKFPIIRLGFNASISYEKKGNWLTRMFD